MIGIIFNWWGAGLEGIGAACEDDCDDVVYWDSGDDFEAKTNDEHYILLVGVLVLKA